MFEATRQSGLARLQAFLPEAGAAYRARRNFDLAEGSAVSRLSPWLRHRLITEQEVLDAVLARHDLPEAMAFVQEVFWRGYIKGWLEQHPTVWTAYKVGCAQEKPEGYAAAIEGRTGIACFDHWSNELRATGYLHNHARMWFASIWIFTLGLPWQLGAAHFLRHLADGDPASNTLGWRWVAGLHTKGKHYLATAENIECFSEGRFKPTGALAENAAPLVESQDHPLRPFFPASDALPERALHLVSEEDCAPLSDVQVAGVLGIVSPVASDFAQAAVRNTVLARGGTVHVGHGWTAAIRAAAQSAGTRDVVVPHMPVGPAADGMVAVRERLAQDGIRLHVVIRPYDQMVWPHATRSFFRLKKQIPAILSAL